MERSLDAVRDKETPESTEASRRLLHDALGTAGLDNFTSMLDAVEEFLTHLQLFDPHVAFGSAASALNDAASAFDKIDANSDQCLDRKELSRYANGLEGNDKEYLEWILAHYDSIEKAFTDGANGISKKDLEYASSFFIGLEFVFANFDKLAGNRAEKNGEDTSNPDASTDRVTLSHQDLEKYLRESEREIDPRQRKGLLQLTMLLRKLGGNGITDQELREIDPEKMWGGA